MKPKLVSDWREVVSHSYAFWLNAAGVALLLINMLGYLAFGIDLDPYWVGWCALFLLIAAMGLRLISQDAPRLTERIRVAVIILLAAGLALLATPRAFGAPVSEAQVISTTMPVTMKWEGLVLTAMKPFSWDRWTLCYGETHGIRPGMTATPAECRQMLRDRLRTEWRGLRPYFTEETLARRMPATRAAGYLDTSHNCGYPNIGASTATRRLNAGNVAGGCEALTWWNRGGHRVLIGLVHRRADDYRYCMEGT